MLILLAGLAVGLVALLPPGPITVSVVGLGARRGGAVATRAGLGVAAGDAIIVLASALVVIAGEEIPHRLQQAITWSSITFVIIVGLGLILRSNDVLGLVDRIERPFRTFCAVTLVSPWVFGGWFAMLAASPFRSDPRSLLTFAAGMLLASVLFHFGLGRGAARLSQILDDTRLLAVTRLGGLLTITIGLILAMI